MRWREIGQSLDWILIGAVVLVVLVGLAMLFTASYQQSGLFAGRFIRQAIAVVVAAMCAAVLIRIPYHAVRRYALIWYGLGILGLIIVFLSARVILGAASRLEIFGVQIQPSEFMKVAMIVTLAWLLARRDQLNWRVVGQSLIVVGIPVGIILLEPDFGVGMLMLMVWGALLIFMGLSWRAVLALGFVGISGLGVAWHWLFAEYQKKRILVFLNPHLDPLGAGYNVLQSIVAFGSGRLVGRGLGHGPQSQLKFLPEQHTDFILASIGEELGFIGVAVIIILYLIILWRILKIARQTQDTFGQLLCIGTFLLLLVSFMVSAGMNMGILPVTGIPLPLLSYGGSNLVSTFLLLGLVESVHVHSKWVQTPPTELSHFV